MQVLNILRLREIIKRHDEGYMFNLQMMVFAEYIDKPFTHVAVDTTLDRVGYWRNTSLNFKQNVK